jgi:hypothetical protein
MKVIAIDVDANQKIIHPGDITIKRGEKAVFTCEDFDFDVFFDPANNVGKNPEHPFKKSPPNPPPGHVIGAGGQFHVRHVRPAGGSTIQNGTRYKYNITILNPGTTTVVDHLDPDLIVDGDK